MYQRGHLSIPGGSGSGSSSFLLRRGIYPSSFYASNLLSTSGQMFTRNVIGSFSYSGFIIFINLYSSGGILACTLKRCPILIDRFSKCQDKESWRCRRETFFQNSMSFPHLGIYGISHLIDCFFTLHWSRKAIFVDDYCKPRWSVCMAWEANVSGLSNRHWSWATQPEVCHHRNLSPP